MSLFETIGLITVAMFALVGSLEIIMWLTRAMVSRMVEHKELYAAYRMVLERRARARERESK